MNTFQFPCKTCGNMIETEYLYCGERAECPFCGQHQIIPSPFQRGFWGRLTAPENRKRFNLWFGGAAVVLLILDLVLLSLQPDVSRKKAAAKGVKTTLVIIPRKREAQKRSSLPRRVSPRQRPEKAARKTFSPERAALLKRLTAKRKQLDRQIDVMHSAWKKAQYRAEKFPDDAVRRHFINRWRQRIYDIRNRNMHILAGMEKEVDPQKNGRLKHLLENIHKEAPEQRDLKELCDLLADPAVDINMSVSFNGKSPAEPLPACLLSPVFKEAAAVLFRRLPDPEVPEKYFTLCNEDFIRYGVLPEMANVLLEKIVCHSNGKVNTELVDYLVFDGAVVTGDMLKAAVRMKNEELLQILLYSGVDPDIFCSDGRTALGYAVMFRNTAFEKLLIAAGADVNKRDKHGKNYRDYRKTDRLWQQWKNADIAFIMQAFEKGEIFHNTLLPDGASLLVDAVRRDDPVLVRYLLEMGVKSDEKGEFPQKPLQVAVSRLRKGRVNYKRMKIIALLVSAGADCSLRPAEAMEINQTVISEMIKTLPMESAVDSQVNSFCEILPFTGSLSDENWCQVLEELFKRKKFLRRVCVEIVKRVSEKALIQFGERTIALYGPVPEHVLLKVVSGMSQVNQAISFGGFTAYPLHWAVYYRRPVSVIRALLKKGADKSLRDSSGRRPVDLTKNPYVKRLLK